MIYDSFLNVESGIDADGVRYLNVPDEHPWRNPSPKGKTFQFLGEGFLPVLVDTPEPPPEE